MTVQTPFKIDPHSIDFENMTLIEASAGTGKTYTITSLYCRLVSRGYMVESILVVTFTEAAAAELKIRIRHRLAGILAALDISASDSDDDLVRSFRSAPDIALIKLRLKTAMTSFDQASVMTIHSFCLKVLKENAFESRSLFDVKLLPDRSVFFKQVISDFFMARINPLDPLLLKFLKNRNFTPETVATLFSNLIARQDLVVKPDISEFKNRCDHYRTIIRQMFLLLKNQREQIIALIDADNSLNKRSYSKKSVPQWLDQTLEKIERQGDNTLFKMAEKGDAVYRFTRACMSEKTKQGKSPPLHEFFDLCEALFFEYQNFEQDLVFLKQSFFEYFQVELEKYKSVNGVCFFDDLVNDLAQGLKGPGGQILVRQIRKTYNACLIDEFQDTDPTQYQIFSTLFADEQTPFFLVGDPKQAIYAFRGGDIFAYLKAAQICRHRTTLEKNYRSAPLLVDGVNTVFGHRTNPFLFEQIAFYPVSTPEKAVNRLVQGDRTPAPLQFCFVPRKNLNPDKQGFISTETARQLIPRIVAQDMLDLMQSNVCLIDRNNQAESISPGSIAVLVRTNAQAEQIQQALSDFNIPSYQSSTGSVYNSQQAIELHDILWAILHPARKTFVKAALATSMFGFSSADMVRLDENEQEFIHFQDLFSDYKILWENRGFMPMIMALFHSAEAFLKTAPQSGKFVLDERKMTNFYHLIELISQTLVRKHRSPGYLFKWYVDQLSKDLRDEAADELRLESDKQAVAIVTIHKSKGLEYPVVYLPYQWSGIYARQKDHALYHDPLNGNCLTLDLAPGNDGQAMAQAAREEQAEDLRLLYVAMTRASALCRIVWGGIKAVQNSALGNLLHPEGCGDDQVMLSDLDRLKNNRSDAVAVYMHQPGKDKQLFSRKKADCHTLSAAVLNRTIEPEWSVSSFSAITQAVVSKPENSLVIESKPDDAPIILKDFPKGAGAGDFFHAIYEEIDFTSTKTVIENLVEAKAKRFDFSDQTWIASAVQSINDVLSTGLVGHDDCYTLNQIGMDQRFTELEFSFNVKKFEISLIKKAFQRSDSVFSTCGYMDRLAQIDTQAFKGFIKGFIDLVVHHQGRWYIVDYKTNFLGETYAHYSTDAVFGAMMEHHYFLQYHLYLVALHRYLGLRIKNYDYTQHIGGVFYLFVRGMKPQMPSNHGVFFQRPSADAVQYLSDNI